MCQYNDNQLPLVATSETLPDLKVFFYGCGFEFSWFFSRKDEHFPQVRPLP